MAAFQVYKDEEKPHVLSVDPSKLKGTKVDLHPRSALEVINTNKASGTNLSKIKSLKDEIPVIEFKDVSEAFKEVKLDSKEDEEIENCSETKRRLPLSDKNVEEPLNDSLSDISFISPGDVDEIHSYQFRLKLHIDQLHDCVEYREDIYEYLQLRESKLMAKALYMRKQPDITYSMRSILIDWLVEVAEEYKLQGETLFMAVSYVDRFLSTMAVVRSKLQLLGTAAMFVAAKYEEIYPPDVGEFIYITDDTYTKRQVLKMEQLILKTLNFDMSGPTLHTFLTHLAKVVEIESNILNLAMYICELTLLEGDPYMQYPPSLVACAAIALARHCRHEVNVWPKELAQTSGYGLRQLAPVLPHLNGTHSNASKIAQTASRDKYKATKYLGIALVPHKQLVVRDSSSTPPSSSSTSS